VVWQMPLRHPDRVAGVIGLNTPFMPRAPADPIAIMRARFGEDMYIVRFQTPHEADEILSRDVARTMNLFMKRPLPGEAPATGGLSREGPAGNADPSSNFALLKMLEFYEPAADARDGFLSAEEMTFFVETFQRTGFTGGVNWYRNITRNWRLAEDLGEKVVAPALMIMAEKDAVLPPSAADGMEAFVTDLEKMLIKDSGHWTQQEKPDQVNRAILNWMDRRFPK
jgi:pimeloyl-ACP methyl ester carboxylesterase